MINKQSWRKSTYSGSQNACVQVNGALTKLGDSKNPEGPVLENVNLGALVAAVKNNQLGDVSPTS